MLSDTIRILGDLVAFPTISSDSNRAMIDYIADHLHACGARVEIFPDDTGEKANLFASLGPDTDGGLVLSGHCDVVPVDGQPWATDPFHMVEHDGRLYGRGTCDMKGFIAACLAMAPHYAGQMRAKPVHFAFTHDEETGCAGAIRLVEALKHRGVRPGLAIVGEPTLMQIVDGHKGCNEYTTRFHGLEGHGSSPDHGVNAVAYAARFATHLMGLQGALKARAPRDCPFTPACTTLNVGAINGGTTHNVIPASAQVDWEMRPIAPGDAEFVKSEMAAFCNETLLPEMRAIHPDARIETEVIGEVADLAPQAQNAATELLARLSGANTTSVVPFGTEAGLFQAMGLDVAVCGPGSIEQAHMANEFIAIDQLQRCLSILQRV